MNKGIDELAATENVLLNFNKYLQDFRMTIFRKKQKKENKKPLTEKQKIVNKIMYKIYIFFKEKNLTSEYKKDITQKIKTYFDNSINKGFSEFQIYEYINKNITDYLNDYYLNNINKIK